MRLITRADLDGLACAALITSMEEIETFVFVEPKFMQDGAVEVRKGDIIANLPHHPNCGLWFDHHITNAPSWSRHLGLSGDAERQARDLSVVPGKGAFQLAPSAARVVYEYYRTVASRDARYATEKAEGLKILSSARMQAFLEETDRIDAGHLTPDEVLRPAGFVLISMTIDGKRPEDEPYWLKLIELFREAALEKILKDSEVSRRCEQVLAAQNELKGILNQRATLRGNVIFLDLRGLKDITDINRFLLYTLFPMGNISLKVAEDEQRPNTTAISVGYNIFNPTSRVNVGALMEKYGGGGHSCVGSCRVPDREAERVIREVFEAIQE